MKIHSLTYGLVIFLSSLTVHALEKYQGADYPVKSWRCGAPLVEALRESDDDGLLNDSAGALKLKESLEAISTSNLTYLKNKLGPLSAEEQSLVTMIATKFPPPIVHRTDLNASKIILANDGMVSATKRKAASKTTPDVEQYLFSGKDCIFTTVAPPFGTQDYGTTLFRFKDKQGFAWGTVYTGFTWIQEVEGKSLTDYVTDGMKARFARMVFTNNHWDEAIALHIIQHVRQGKTFRNRGSRYNKDKILGDLLAMDDADDFWGKIIRHRLAYLEGHYLDNVPNSQFSFVQFRNSDKSTVLGWGFPDAWFKGGSSSFLRFFNRTLIPDWSDR